MTINGRIDEPGDRDCFRFRATAGQKLTIRVLAQRLGSRLDAVLQVLDSQGKPLATADDSPLNDRLPPATRPSQPPQTEADALLEFAAPKNGEYVVTLDDRYLFGGRDFAYRLQIAGAKPDFELIAQPGEARDPKQKGRRARQGQQVLAEFAGQGTGALSLDRGGRGTVVVVAARRGYDGPLRLRVEDLPAGVFAAETVLPPGQTQGTIVFRSDFDAKSVAGFVRIVGEAEIDGQTVSRTARQPVIYTGLGNVIAQHDLDRLAVGVSARRAELALRGELMAAAVQGGKSQLRVAVRKRKGVQGPVTVRVANLPSGIEAPPITLGEKQAEATLDLAVGAGVIPGKRFLELEGSLSVKGRKAPLLASAVVEVEIQPAVAWELETQQVEVARGGQTTVLIHVRRLGGSTEAIELSTSRLPSGLSIESLSVPPDADKFPLVIRASDQASPSPLRRIVQLKGATRLGERKIELPTLRLALKVTRG